MTNVRESKDISRAELIYMIAKFRGTLYSIRNGKRKKDWTEEELTRLLEKTTFNISQDTDDEVDWNEFHEKYL